MISPFFRRTQDRVAPAHGTNSPAFASENLLLLPSSILSSSDRCTPWCSSKALCSRSRVHNSNGYPKLRGFCKAKSSRALRVSWLCVGGRPARFASIRPAIPFSLKRLTHWIPIGAPLKPTFSPAREAGNLGSSSMASITCALWTNLIGSLRDFANRLISVSSSFVNVRNAIRFGISSSCFPRGLF